MSGYEYDEYWHEGWSAAFTIALSDDMLDLLYLHGFGADFMLGLTDEEEERLPTCPYDGENNEREDAWKSGFAAGMEDRV